MTDFIIGCEPDINPLVGAKFLKLQTKQGLDKNLVGRQTGTNENLFLVFSIEK